MNISAVITIEISVAFYRLWKWQMREMLASDPLAVSGDNHHPVRADGESGRGGETVIFLL